MMRGILVVLISISCAGAALAAQDIAPGVTLVPGTFVAGTQPDGNTVILKGPDGLIVFDTGRHAEHVQQILDFAAASRAPVAAIVNSHWHLDHVGGNVKLRQAFPNARVVASAAIEDAMHGFLANYHAQLEDLIAKAGDGWEQYVVWESGVGDPPQPD